MFGINLREIVLVTLVVVFVLGGVVGGLSLPRPYKDTLMLLWYITTVIMLVFLIVRWFIRRRRRD
jgi:membrane protein DedA with SNARE-associated domain